MYSPGVGECARCFGRSTAVMNITLQGFAEVCISMLIVLKIQICQLLYSTIYTSPLGHMLTTHIQILINVYTQIYVTLKLIKRR